MPAHRAETARHRAAPSYALPEGHRHRPLAEKRSRTAARYATAIGIVTTALFIAFAQAPAVERATALADARQLPSPSTELATLGSAARLTVEVAAPPQLTPRLGAARAARSAQRDPREAGRQLATTTYGWTGREWTCLDSLWKRESGWNYRAENRTSGAYGIPQALPGSKMSSVGRDWRTNPVTQMRWGLRYIKSSYGSPCSAWGHSQSSGWY